MRCELHGTRHDEGEQSEQRDVGSGIDDDQEWSSHELMVLGAAGVQLRQPWQSAENVGRPTPSRTRKPSDWRAFCAPAI